MSLGLGQLSVTFRWRVWGYVFLCLAFSACGPSSDSANAPAPPDPPQMTPSESGARPEGAEISTEEPRAIQVADIESTEESDPSAEGPSTLEISQTSNAAYLRDLADDLVHLDPRREGWVTEVVTEAVSKRFAEISSYLTGEKTDQDWAERLGDTFVTDPLRPVNRQSVFNDSGMIVERALVGIGAEADRQRLSGVDGFTVAVKSLLARFGDLSDTRGSQDLNVRAYFKVIGVEVDRHASTTRVLVEIVGEAGLGRLQQMATWECTWLPARVRGGLPLLGSIKVLAFEETWMPDRREPVFRDDTVAVLGENSSFREQLALGLDYWRDRVDWRFTLEVTGPHGLSVGDVNGDGLDDLFVCETGGLPNRLFVQQPDGRLNDVSATSGLDFLEPTASALFVDLDNDGDQDVAMSSGRNILFLENDGGGQFSRRQIFHSEAVARTLTAIDFDQDGLLDIYVCGYFAQSGDNSGIGRPLPYHDANNGVRNYLLDNLGGWDFADVTEAVGLGENNQRFSYSAAWEDYDRDGDLDLYVANDFGRNNLFRNDDGRFRDVAASAGVEDLSAGMSVSWGDYNADGWPDLYVGNMFSSAGNRVAYQRQYRAEGDEASRAAFQRHARGNSLFANMGDGTFRDVSVEADVTMGRWAWASPFADLNNDGWDDLVVANGLVTNTEDTGDL